MDISKNNTGLSELHLSTSAVPFNNDLNDEAIETLLDNWSINGSDNNNTLASQCLNSSTTKPTQSIDDTSDPKLTVEKLLMQGQITRSTDISLYCRDIMQSIAAVTDKSVHSIEHWAHCLASIFVHFKLKNSKYSSDICLNRDDICHMCQVLARSYIQQIAVTDINTQLSIIKSHSHDMVKRLLGSYSLVTSNSDSTESLSETDQDRIKQLSNEIAQSFLHTLDVCEPVLISMCCPARCSDLCTVDSHPHINDVLNDENKHDEVKTNINSFYHNTTHIKSEKSLTKLPIESPKPVQPVIEDVYNDFKAQSTVWREYRNIIHTHALLLAPSMLEQLKSIDIHADTSISGKGNCIDLDKLALECPDKRLFYDIYHKFKTRDWHLHIMSMDKDIVKTNNPITTIDNNNTINNTNIDNKNKTIANNNTAPPHKEPPSQPQSQPLRTVVFSSAYVGFAIVLAAFLLVPIQERSSIMRKYAKCRKSVGFKFKSTVVEIEMLLTAALESDNSLLRRDYGSYQPKTTKLLFDVDLCDYGYSFINPTPYITSFGSSFIVSAFNSQSDWSQHNPIDIRISTNTFIKLTDPRQEDATAVFLVRSTCNKYVDVFGIKLTNRTFFSYNNTITNLSKYIKTDQQHVLREVGMIYIVPQHIKITVNMDNLTICEDNRFDQTMPIIMFLRSPLQID